MFIADIFLDLYLGLYCSPEVLESRTDIVCSQDLGISSRVARKKRHAMLEGHGRDKR